MKIKMENLKNIGTETLITELKSRGFKTDLLYGLGDVDLQVEYINDDREDNDKIELDESEKEDILDDVFETIFDYICERINNCIQEKIYEHVD